MLPYIYDVSTDGLYSYGLNSYCLTVMASIIMDYVVMTHVSVTCVVMACEFTALCRYCLCSYALCSYGLIDLPYPFFGLIVVWPKCYMPWPYSYALCRDSRWSHHPVILACVAMPYINIAL